MFTKFDNYEILLAVNEIVAAQTVDKKALGKIRRCFTQIISNYGFFSDLLFQLKIIEAAPGSGVDTMATDGICIAYSPNFVNQLTEQENIFVLIHEIMHNANFHFARMSGRDPQLWNVAADYAINLQIDDMKKELKHEHIMSPPSGILLDEQYRGMNAEMIYDLLVKNQKPNKQGQGQPGQGKPGQGKPGQGQPGQGQPGQGQPGQGKAGGTPEGDIRKPGSLTDKGTTIYQGNDQISDAKNVDELEKAWEKARSNASAKNAGTGSASLDRWIRKVNKPKINWRAELRKFVAQIYDQLDYAYSNKRYIWQDMHLPGPKNADKSTYQNVIIAIDTSGSINDDTLAKFGAEILKLFKTYNVNKCYVIWCDSDIPVDGVQLFDVADKSFKLDKLKPKGGGGTSFKPPFKWIQTNILKKGKIPAFVIYFTDAFGDAPSPSEYSIKSYQNRVLWVITDNDQASHIKFGKKLFIDKMP
jgi:predicted metal-dependent peptidase